MRNLVSASLCMLLQPLEAGDARTDHNWVKSALKEINSQLKDSEKKMLALKNSIDDARVDGPLQFLIFLT